MCRVSSEDAQNPQLSHTTIKTTQASARPVPEWISDQGPSAIHPALTTAVPLIPFSRPHSRCSQAGQTPWGQSSFCPHLAHLLFRPPTHSRVSRGPCTPLTIKCSVTEGFTVCIDLTVIEFPTIKLILRQKVSPNGPQSH